jgi:hypothetical protein
MSTTFLLVVAMAMLGALGWRFLARGGARGRFQALYLAMVIFVLTLAIIVREGERLGLFSVCFAAGAALVGYIGWWMRWPAIAESLRRSGYRDDW